MFLGGYLGMSAGTQRNSAFVDLIVADKNMEDMDSHTSGSGLLHYFGKQFLAFFLKATTSQLCGPTTWPPWSLATQKKLEPNPINAWKVHKYSIYNSPT